MKKLSVRKAITALLVLCLLIAALPSAILATSDMPGYFYFSVATNTKTVIAPSRVTYTSGQTVLEALEASGYDIKFQGSDKTFVETIEGVSANFVRFHDYTAGGSDYDLTVPADKIHVLAFTETEGQNNSSVIALIRRVGEVGEMTNGVRNYTRAGKAYDAALSGLRTATAEQAETLLTELNAAVSEYEALLNGTKYTVTVSATQNGTAVANPVIRMTDSYGNVTEAADSSVKVIAGDYTFEVSDGGYNCTRGSLTVSADTALSAELPYGEWFGTVRLSRSSLGNYDSYVYPSEIANANEGTFYVYDCTTLLYLNAEIGAVPDTSKTKIRTVYEKTNGGDASTISRSWNSNATSMAYCLTYGMEGRTVSLEAQYTKDNGYTQVQSYTMHLVRVPTLSSVTVKSPDGTVQMLTPVFDPYTNEYSVTAVTDSILLGAEGYGEGYAVSGTGTIASSANTDAVISVSAEGQTAQYTLHITHSDAANVTVNTPSGCTAEIRDAAGNTVMPTSDGSYGLIPGSSYTCITTKNTWYHTSVTFTASDGLTVKAAEPITADAVQSAVLYDNTAASSRKAFEPESAFSSDTHSLRYVISDTVSRVYAQTTAEDGYTVTALYDNLNAVSKEVSGTRETTISNTVGASTATRLVNLITTGCMPATVTLRASKTDGGITYYQDYILRIVRQAHLKSRTLVLAADGSDLTLTDSAGTTVTFDPDTTDYYMQVANTTESFTLTAQFAASDDYRAEIAGESFDTLSGVTVALDTEKETEVIAVKVLCNETDAVSTEYRLHFVKKAPVAVTFAVTPGDANVFLVNNNTGSYAYPENGTILLPPGASYSYTVTRSGYVGQKVTDFTVPESAATVTVTLTKAADRTYTAQEEIWPSFRADEYNNGVVNAKTPTTAEDAVLYWATQLGEGYSADACGCPILVGDYLYTYAKSSIYKLNVVTGEVEATGTMDHSSSFAINSPTYAEGMIFVGLSNGTVQAFDADTLESLWIFHDSLGGQPNCPITYHNGYIYTGFWQGEQLKASFVCISVTDEDPTNAKEEKLASWQYASLGGFYWAGAYVTDEYVLVTTDDGAAGYTTGYARLLSLDTKTGALIDSVSLPHTGDARSSVVYSNGRAYFTTKGGYFYSAAVASDGTLSDLWYVKLYNYADDAQNPAMSTCSPVIYNGRAYIGVSGVGQFKAYSGHNITVIDLSSRSIAYTVRTQGYPQTSGLLTTAYDEGDGTVYVYFIDNFTPGKVRVLRDKPGQTAPDLTETETVSVQGEEISYETASVLFTPDGDQAQYAICSPITDASGTLYFKNDSAYMMAVGSTITELRVDSMPTKLTYRSGETFDATGMKITAVYKNGCERDVTKYVTYSTDALGAEDASFEVRFEHVMYQNVDGEGGSQTPVTPPSVTIELTITPTVLGDVNADGKVTAADAAMVSEHVRNASSEDTAAFRLTEEQQTYADVDGDGEITEADAKLIYQYSLGEITAFPAKSPDETTD